MLSQPFLGGRPQNRNIWTAKTSLKRFFFKKKKIGNKVEKEGNWLVWANLLEGGEYVVKELYGVNEWSGITHKVVFVDESQRECLSKG